MKKISYLLVLSLLLTSCQMSSPEPPTVEQEQYLHTEAPPPSPSPEPEENTYLPPTPNEINQLNNKTIGWGFRKIKGQRPDFGSAADALMEKYNCIHVGNQEEKYLYLTFDEGYENGYTGTILDTLKKTGVKAAFFITGPYLKDNEDLVRRMVEEGHIVGNHTINHPSLPCVSDDEIEEEILGLDRKFYDMYGKSMAYIRAPRGEYSERTLATTKALGYTDVFWSLAYKDWEPDKQKGADYAYTQVMEQLHNGCVLLLHAVSKDNTEALERIIISAQEQGYAFLSLDEFKR